MSAQELIARLSEVARAYGWDISLVGAEDNDDDIVGIVLGERAFIESVLGSDIESWRAAKSEDVQ